MNDRRSWGFRGWAGNRNVRVGSGVTGTRHSGPISARHGTIACHGKDNFVGVGITQYHAESIINRCTGLKLEERWIQSRIKRCRCKFSTADIPTIGIGTIGIDTTAVSNFQTRSIAFGNVPARKFVGRIGSITSHHCCRSTCIIAVQLSTGNRIVSILTRFFGSENINLNWITIRSLLSHDRAFAAQREQQDQQQLQHQHRRGLVVAIAVAVTEEREPPSDTAVVVRTVESGRHEAAAPKSAYY